MSEHVPAPWAEDATGWHGKYPSLHIHYEDNYGVIIADVLSEEVGLETAKANAALIVAAPEMFAAIKCALRIQQLWMPPEEQNDPEHEDEFVAIAAMRRTFREVIDRIEEITEAPSSEG